MEQVFNILIINILIYYLMFKIINKLNLFKLTRFDSSLSINLQKTIADINKNSGYSNK